MAVVTTESTVTTLSWTSHPYGLTEATIENGVLTSLVVNSPEGIPYIYPSVLDIDVLKHLRTVINDIVDQIEPEPLEETASVYVEPEPPL